MIQFAKRHFVVPSLLVGMLSEPDSTPTLSHRRGPPLEAGQVGTRSEARGPYLQCSTLTPRQNGTSTSPGIPRGTRRHLVEPGGGSAATPVPLPARRLNLIPARLRPAFECCDRLLEGSAEIGQFVESRGVQAAGVDVSNDESVPLSSSKRVGEDFVGDTVESVVEFLIAATPAIDTWRERRASIDRR